LAGKFEGVAAEVQSVYLGSRPRELDQVRPHPTAHLQHLAARAAVKLNDLRQELFAAVAHLFQRAEKFRRALRNAGQIPHPTGGSVPEAPDLFLEETGCAHRDSQTL